jgi:hypothetical protein
MPPFVKLCTTFYKRGLKRPRPKIIRIPYHLSVSVWKYLLLGTSRYTITPILIYFPLGIHTHTYAGTRAGGGGGFLEYLIFFVGYPTLG